MKLFIQDWFIVPCQTLHAAAQLAFMALALVLIALFILWLCRPRPRPKSELYPKVWPDRRNACLFIGGPLDGKLIPVEPQVETHRCAIRKPMKFERGEISEVAASIGTYRRTSRHEFRFVDPECDHDWHFVDQSFDHAFGTEKVHTFECSKCGMTRAANPGDYEGPDDR